MVQSQCQEILRACQCVCVCVCVCVEGGGAAMLDFMKKYGQEWRFASEHSSTCLCNCSPDTEKKTGALQQYSLRMYFFFLHLSLATFFLGDF